MLRSFFYYSSLFLLLGDYSNSFFYSFFKTLFSGKTDFFSDRVGLVYSQSDKSDSTVTGIILAGMVVDLALSLLIAASISTVLYPLLIKLACALHFHAIKLYLIDLYTIQGVTINTHVSDALSTSISVKLLVFTALMQYIATIVYSFFKLLTLNNSVFDVSHTFYKKRVNDFKIGFFNGSLIRCKVVSYFSDLVFNQDEYAMVLLFFVGNHVKLYGALSIIVYFLFLVYQIFYQLITGLRSYALNKIFNERVLRPILDSNLSAFLKKIMYVLTNSLFCLATVFFTLTFDIFVNYSLCTFNFKIWLLSIALLLPGTACLMRSFTKIPIKLVYTTFCEYLYKVNNKKTGGMSVISMKVLSYLFYAIFLTVSRAYGRF